MAVPAEALPETLNLSGAASGSLRYGENPHQPARFYAVAGAPDEAPAGYASTGASTFNRAWTLLGLPCVNVAGAVGVTGHPMGLQVIGAPRADRQCLRVADFLESALKRPA